MQTSEWPEWPHYCQLCTSRQCDDPGWCALVLEKKIRDIPIHTLSAQLGPSSCMALSLLHAVTGCDECKAIWWPWLAAWARWSSILVSASVWLETRDVLLFVGQHTLQVGAEEKPPPRWCLTSSLLRNGNSSFLLSMFLRNPVFQSLSLIHIWRCRRSYACRSRWSPYH